jgi:beta-lactamase regulating signal transducer with metallopeptidase domain
MARPWNELHSLILYIIFGYTLLLPLVLICLKFFRITSPLQRLRIYLLAFLTPPASFVLYHTILTKRCEAGMPPIWAEGAFNLLCIVSEGMLRAVLPLTVLLLALGTLKAITAILMTKRLDREATAINADAYALTIKILNQLCAVLKITPPRVIFSRRNDFAAFTTGLLKPVLVINGNITQTLNEGELQVLLSHELIHIRDRDAIKSWLLHLVRDLTFLNPFSNTLLKKYLLEKEVLCDQKAARLLNKPNKAYASALVKIWRSVLDNRSPVTLSGSSFKGDGSGLERRVEALIQSKQDENIVSSYLTFIIGSFLFVTTLLFLGLVC